MNSDNCMLQACYKDMVSNNDQWMVNVKEELQTSGLGYIWESQYKDECIKNYQTKNCRYFRSRL